MRTVHCSSRHTHRRPGVLPSTVLLAVAVAIILVSASFAYLLSNVYFAAKNGSSTTLSPSSSGSTATTANSGGGVDIFFTSSCSVTGVGGFEIRVVSDSTNESVGPESLAILAVDRLSCNGEAQTVYIDNFQAAEGTVGDWLVPVFPSHAVPGGGLSFTVAYQGETYDFTSYVPPVGTACVTLHVPSGGVTTTTVMNGTGSYCPQTESSPSAATTNASSSSVCISPGFQATCPSSTTTVTAPSGLELRVGLSSATIASGQTLAANVTLFNSLDKNLTLVPNFPSNSTMQEWTGYDYICDGYNQTPELGFALFEGYYSADNLSLAGSPVRLAPPVEPPCATWPDPTSLVFLPESDNAIVYGAGSANGTLQTISLPVSTESCTWNGAGGTCGPGQGLFGYWASSAGPITYQEATVGSPYFGYFSAGRYTLVVEDVWGQTVLVHFRVSS